GFRLARLRARSREIVPQALTPQSLLFQSEAEQYLASPFMMMLPQGVRAPLSAVHKNVARVHWDRTLRCADRRVTRSTLASGRRINQANRLHEFAARRQKNIHSEWN